MSNGLSQAEIDALLNGGLDSTDDASQPVLSDESGHTMTPEEIETMLEKVGAAPISEPPAETPAPVDFSQVLSGMETDVIGEIGNISMGTAATTLFSLLNHKVDITTPRVSVTTMGEMAQQYPMPFVSVEVQYTLGLEGTNCLFLHENDVKIITDLMMGGDGTNTNTDLNDMHLSCISEVMNQMVGASSTSLSQMLSIPIDISPPRATQVRLSGGGLEYPFNQTEEPVVRIGFDMVVEGLINSEIMQVMPVEFAKAMVAKVMNMGSEPSGAEAAPPPPPPEPQPVPSSAPPQPAQQPYPPQQDPYGGYPPPPPAYAQQPYPPQQDPYGGYPPPPPAYAPQPYPQPASPYGGYPPPPPAYAPQPQQHPVDVRPANFASFGDSAAAAGMGENMDILLDVPLSVSVELGKSRKYIKEILDFNVGTIVVLDKMAGELVDVVVNGKLIAQGEVVIIDDNYGCRITDIVSPSKRLDSSK